jgi:anti-anti-sigma regulatory factor
MAREMEGDQVYADTQLVVSRTSTPAELRVSGTIDYRNAEAFAAALIAELHQTGDLSTALFDAITGNRDLHLDLSRLEFTDVTGIRALVRIAEAAETGRRLVLRGLPARIRTVMVVVGWADLPNLVIDKDEL